MNQKITDLINLFGALGDHLKTFGSDSRSAEVISRAVQQNEWFTENDIRAAVYAIRIHMLDRQRLNAWLEPYDLRCDQPKRVGVIMAGNIPLVGFFDLLCVIVSGCEASIKYSSKDRALMEYVVEQLKTIDPDIPINNYRWNERIDAIIATGSDNTNRYFRAEFADIPSLLRGSRHSVAVLNGDESDKQIDALSKDIFTYSGLGCRNVSRLFVPVGYDINRLTTRLSMYEGINPKYVNNYRQNRALHIMNCDEFVDGNFFTFRHTTENSLYISELCYNYYSSMAEIEQWVTDNDHRLQCVVSESVAHPRRVSFGQAQSPQLTDYPDAIDVIDFLKNI